MVSVAKRHLSLRPNNLLLHRHQVPAIRYPRNTISKRTLSVTTVPNSTKMLNCPHLPPPECSNNGDTVANVLQKNLIACSLTRDRAGHTKKRGCSSCIQQRRGSPATMKLDTMASKMAMKGNEMAMKGNEELR